MAVNGAASGLKSRRNAATLLVTDQRANKAALEYFGMDETASREERARLFSRVLSWVLRKNGIATRQIIRTSRLDNKQMSEYLTGQRCPQPRSLVQLYNSIAFLADLDEEGGKDIRDQLSYSARISAQALRGWDGKAESKELVADGC